MAACTTSSVAFASAGAEGVVGVRARMQWARERLSGPFMGGSSPAARPRRSGATARVLGVRGAAREALGIG